MSIPKATEKNPSYENFEARCPICSHWNVYNRASDFKSFGKITGKNVVCQNNECKKEFRISGDLINPSWQMLILDCEILKQYKRYSYCMLNLCQAYEMYYSLYLKVELIYKPNRREKNYDVDRLNELLQLLYDKTKDWAYLSLRNAMMHLIIRQIHCNKLSEAKNIIQNPKLLIKTEPADNELRNIEDKKLSNVLLELKKNTIHSVRNQVIHKYGYRPTLKEVERAEENAGILYKLDKHLGVLSQESYLYEYIL